MLYYAQPLIRFLRRNFRIRLLGWLGESNALSCWGYKLACANYIESICSENKSHTSFLFLYALQIPDADVRKRSRVTESINFKSFGNRDFEFPFKIYADFSKLPRANNIRIGFLSIKKNNTHLP